MNESRSIPKEISSEYGRDFAFLRRQGLKYIEELSHKLWTDYNTHDPGVTMLEMLCYAITDLGYRIAMPVEDILAKPKDNLQQMHRQFLSAIHSLPSSPVSADDYRQLFVRVDGVRNAWIMASDRQIVARYAGVAQPGVPELHYMATGEVVDPKKARVFGLHGLNNILIDYDESSLLTEEEKKKDAATRKLIIAGNKKKIAQRVLEIYQRYRNLCEDIDTLQEVPRQGVVICGDIDIEPLADPEQVWARIVFNIDQYLAPDIPFHSLQEMQEMGKSSDQIFDGPAFDFTDGYSFKTPGNPFSKKGFICREDLAASELRTQVRLSDIMRIIMETEGVKLIKEIAFGLCGCDEKDMDNVRKAVSGDKWNLCITPGNKPVFCVDNSVLNFWKELMPIELKMTEAKQGLDALRAERNMEMQSKLTEDIPMPLGVYRDVIDYQTFQNHFPETYGIGRTGLPPSSTIQRKSQAKQLKAYLLFFEQVLANYFSQLANVGVLFSADKSIARTYFANVVNGLVGVDEIVDDTAGWQKEVEELLINSGLDPYIARKNMFLDHLLARFAEHFSDYVFLMHRLYGQDADRILIRNKVDFLKDYDHMSTSRGSGFDYYNPRSDQEMLVNIPGMEKRISRLLGFNHYRRLPLSGLSYQVVETTKVKMTVNGILKDVQQYGWSIKMGSATVLESVNRSFLKRTDAYEELGLASLLGCERTYYTPVLSVDKKKVSFTLLDTKNQAIASHPVKYSVKAADLLKGSFPLLEKKINEVILYLLEEFRLEGMYAVEHILLRPEFTIPLSKKKLFFPVCIESDGSCCRPIDPYSFRVTVVLPGYSMRFRNKYFRQFAERLIRMETPAHVLPRICFVNEEYMKKFEDAYHHWLNSRHKSSDPRKQAPDAVLTALLRVIEEMFTVYEEGQLTDCDDDTPEKNPVVLGRSRLGSLESDSKPG